MRGIRTKNSYLNKPT